MKNTLPLIYLGKALILFIFFTSCTPQKRVLTTESPVGNLRFDIVEDAKDALGTGYRYGDTGRKGYDCSGLVFSVYTQNNVSLPRSTREMSRAGKSIKKSELLPGDLVFFKNVNKIDHVAIVSKVSGNTTWLIHSTTSQGVVETKLEESIYWAPRVVDYRRLIHN